MIAANRNTEEKMASEMEADPPAGATNCHKGPRQTRAQRDPDLFRYIGSTSSQKLVNPMGSG